MPLIHNIMILKSFNDMKRFILILILPFQLFCQGFSLSVSGGIISYKFLLSDDLGKEIDINGFLNYSDNTIFSLSTGYQEWSEPYGVGGSDFKSIPILVGIRFPVDYDNISLYFAGEIGAVIITRRFIFEKYETISFGFYRFLSSESKKESDISLNSRFSIGIIYSINKKFSFDIGIRYSIIDYEYIYLYPDNISQKIYLYNYNIGIIYNFN